jgi:hypothetical protein
MGSFTPHFVTKFIILSLPNAPSSCRLDRVVIYQPYACKLVYFKPLHTE